MNPTVLFIDNPHPSMEKELRALGYDIEKKDISYSELATSAHKYVGYIIRSKFVIDQHIIDRSIHLQFIARIGAGMENIDVDYAKQKKIHCLNSPEGNADAVGEFVIATLLNLLRNIQKADTEVRNGIWDRKSNLGNELCHKTVGIIGYGNMGKNLAGKLKSFGCELLAHDKFKTGFGDEKVKEVSLKEIWKYADIVSLHINYLPENYYYVNKNWLQAFEKNIYLINTSRGKILHTADLANAIQQEKIKAAALDVLEYENIRLQNKPIEEWDDAMHFLARSPKVILSPHIAGQTFESSEKHVGILIEKIKKEVLLLG